MDLADLRAAVQARGFNHIGTAETNRWINESYQELCEEAPWPFLEASTTGTAPLTIADVRTLLSVTDTTHGTGLTVMDRRAIVDLDPEVDDTGTPDRCYLDNLTLRVYPLNTTDTIAVRYIKVPTELTDDADEPLVPARYQELIVDGAVIACYKSSDEFGAAQAVRSEYDIGVQKMRRNLLSRNWANTDSILITDVEGWSV